ncbi:hypothetical protein M5689_020386 [Euphorbia peplus]|nr:hypothetical protein M5689_020386 [Euphorbia peplus]
MSATIISDTVLITPETQQPPPSNLTEELESAKCECCGLTEECTPAYISRIRERYYGKWICGLCAEAVKDEIIRATTDQSLKKMISTEEAMTRHMNFCKKFVSSGPPNHQDPTIHLISAMRQILRRSLDSPRASSPRSTPTSPNNNVQIRGAVLTRSESCFPTLSG